MDLSGRGDKDGDLLFAKETSLSGQLVLQSKLRMMAQEAAAKGAANSKLRSLLAYNKSSKCTDVQIGDTAPFYEAIHRKSTPRWRGPAKTLDIDEPGATVEFQSQTFKVARHCVRKKDEEDVGEVAQNPSQDQPTAMELAPRGVSTLRDEGNEMEMEAETADTSSSAGAPGDSSHSYPEATPVPPAIPGRAE